jgi:uncharacterized protein YbaP (TraB family)
MRAFLTAFLIAMTGPAQALCSGPDVRSMLTDTDQAAVAQAVADTPYGQGKFFHAAKGDAQITVIGTMHLFDPRLVPLAARAAPIVAASDLLLVEAGPQEKADLMQAMATDPTLIFMPDGPTLPERMDEGTWQLIVQAAGDRGIPAILVAKMQPWYVGLTLAIPPCAIANLQSGKDGLDGMIIDQAVAAGVDVQPLEPWDTLFNLMRSAPIDMQVDQLRLTMSPPDLQVAMFATMLDSYFAGNIAELWHVSRAATHLLPNINAAEADTLFDLSEQQLLTDRNRAWIPVIEDAAANHGRITVAVGAAHLQGQTGLINLLKLAGWAITPL